MADQPDSTTSLAAPAPIITLNSACLSRMIAAGVIWFERHHEVINRLNVFPVPDGDTGTNMLHTLRAAYKRMDGADSEAAGERASALATGAIYGSRGNSGTLLSQMFDGFAKALHGHTEIDAKALAQGFREAVRLAYRALQEPKEGTILTVAREIAEEVEDAAATTNDLKTILERIVVRGSDAVRRTPDLLPILKHAGVVDSGGQGLVVFFEGMLRAMRGETVLTLPSLSGAAHSEQSTSSAAARSDELHQILQSEDERGYGYDVQYIIRGENLDIEQIRRDISAMGDSMVVVGDTQLAKVHIHVHDPGIPISYGVKLGVIQDVIVENMQDQSEGYIAMRQSEEIADPAMITTINYGDAAVIAVAPGKGLRGVFFNVGVAHVISGGPTMNPSVQEFLTAMEDIPTNRFVLLPNDKNVILAAQQAAKLAVEQGKLAVVVPTVSVPQGISAMLAFQPQIDLNVLEAEMQEAAESIKTGEVTVATRDVEMDGIRVREGQYIGLADGMLVSADDELFALLLDLLEKMDARAAEVVTLYPGAEISSANAEQTSVRLRDYYGELPQFTTIPGGQPHYQYILSVE